MSWSEAIFQYDGTFDGFLCCIFESYVQKEFPIAFSRDEELDVISFYSIRVIPMIPTHAQRVLRSLANLSPAVVPLLRKAFFTCMPDKEQHLYALVRKLYREGCGFLKNPSDEVYYPVAKALRHLSGELEKLRGFIRFSDYNGVLGAEIEPKNQVLPLLRKHFCARYANEQLFIYDRTHHELLLYSRGRSRILFVDSLELEPPDAQELQYRKLWKCFYETIEIKERHNERCQNTFLPKRYRSTMTEFLPTDYEQQARLSASMSQQRLQQARSSQ